MITRQFIQVRETQGMATFIKLLSMPQKGGFVAERGPPGFVVFLDHFEVEKCQMSRIVSGTY